MVDQLDNASTGLAEGKNSVTATEKKVIIALIDMYQFDDAEWTIDGVKLSELKKKLLKKCNSTLTKKR